MHATLLSLALLCLSAAEKQTATVASQAKPRPVLAKGVIVEAIINDLDNGKGDEAIDLDRSQQFDLPDMHRLSDQQRQNWILNNKVDLLVEQSSDGWALATADVKLKELANGKWDTITLAELDGVLSAEAPSADSDTKIIEVEGFRFHILNRGATVPQTFAFKTAEGNLGVMQITEFRQEPKGIKIRYRLPATQAARPKTGSTRGTFLFVRTEPAGAEVLVDGRRVGVSDDLFRIEPGVRTIVIKLDGHDPEDEEVTIRAGRVERLELKLTTGATVTEAEAELAAIKARLPFIPLDDFLCRRQPRDYSADGKIDTVWKSLVRLYSPKLPVAHLKTLSGHADPDIRTLAMLGLVANETPEVVPVCIQLMNDRAVTIPAYILAPPAHAGRNWPGPGDRISHPQTVADIAKKILEMVDCPLRQSYPVAGHAGGPGRQRKATIVPATIVPLVSVEPDAATWWASRKDNPDWLSWYQFLYMRASHGSNPPPADARADIQRFRKMIDALPPATRSWTFLYLSEDVFSVHGRWENHFATEEKMISAVQDLGAETLIEFLRSGKRQGLREPSLDEGRNGHRFIVTYARHFFTEEHAEALLQLKQFTAAADANPRIVRRAVDAAMQHLTREYESWDRAKVMAALASLGDDSDRDRAVEWFSDEPNKEGGSSPQGIFIGELERRHPEQWRYIVRRIVANPKFDQLRPIDVMYLARMVEKLGGEQLIGDGYRYRDDADTTRNELRKLFQIESSEENVLEKPETSDLTKSIRLSKADTPNADVVLDLASGQTMVPPDGDHTDFAHLGKGDLFYMPRFLGCLRGAKPMLWDGERFVAMQPLSGGRRPTDPDDVIESPPAESPPPKENGAAIYAQTVRVEPAATGYKLPKTPCRLLITTAEGKHFDVTILSMTAKGGMTLEYRSADPSIVPKELLDEAAVREVVSRYVDAIRQRDMRTLATCLANKKYLDADELGRWREAMSAGLKMDEIREVQVGGNLALVATPFVGIPELGHNKPVCVVYNLTKQETGWTIRDMDVENKEGLTTELGYVRKFVDRLGEREDGRH